MPGRYVSERLVGRDRELSHLAVALDAATDGHSPRVMISGVGGIGVSRLVSETARRVAKLNEPFRFIRCVAVPARRSQAYAPIVSGLREPAARGSLGQEGGITHAAGLRRAAAVDCSSRRQAPWRAVATPQLHRFEAVMTRAAMGAELDTAEALASWHLRSPVGPACGMNAVRTRRTPVW